MSETKIIVTHLGALAAKYGAAAPRVMKAVDALIAADAKRGIASRLVGLDSARDMAAFRARPMGGPDDRKGAKRTVDAIDAECAPHYILILGGPDVVPLQLLENPTGALKTSADGGDWDPNVPSDLPYACDAPFSDEPADFQGPCRVVGRLPDVPGAKSPVLLVKLLRLAAAAKPLPRSAYDDWLALSTQSWEVSTRKSVKKLFGSASKLLTAPPHADRWSARALAPRAHFINCHGAVKDIAFYGEDKKDHDEQPVAIRGPGLAGKVRPGTVVSAECCYGAQVFDPDGPGTAHPGRLCMALQYLRQGACGVFGATTIAYGPERDNDFADVICRIFLERVLAGASLGRAALEARLAYLKSGTSHNPVRLKTIAQFYLLGDPSIHPVAIAGPYVSRKGVRVPVYDGEAAAKDRKRRRARLRRQGLALQNARTVLKRYEGAVPPRLQDELFALAQGFGMKAKFIRAFDLVAAMSASAAGDDTPGTSWKAAHALMLIDAAEEVVGPPRDTDEPAKAGRGKVPRIRILLAQERASKIVRYKLIVSR